MASSLERTIHTFRRSTAAAPVWTGKATTLERVGIAQYAPDVLETYAELTPLEALVAATYNASNPRKDAWLDTVHKHHPDLSAAYIQEMSIETNYDWRHTGRNTWHTPTQHLIVQYEAVRRRLSSLADPMKTFDGAVMPAGDILRWFARSKPSLYQDAMLQRIIACNDIATFDAMVASGKTIDPQAYAIGFLQTSDPTDKWYAHMDDEAFGGLVAYDPDWEFPSLLRQATLRNPCLHRYPWEKMPVILEHHPSCFFASVMTRQEMANNTAKVSQWFLPMLDAVGERIANNPRYTSTFTEIALSKHTKNNFNTMLQTYAPREYEALQCMRQFEVDSESPDALMLWAQWLARSKNPTMNLELPALDM